MGLGIAHRPKEHDLDPDSDLRWWYERRGFFLSDVVD